MGEVYRARDTKLNRDVAIKVLPDLFAQDADRLARFTREAQTLATLNHPNIAAIYGIEGNAIVMELVDGQDLSALIGGTQALNLRDALAIARQIAEALEAAHEAGIVHRDLKPANIKVRDDGTVKVLDFGLAKAMDPSGASNSNAANSPTLTAHASQMGLIIGTAAYMAPEQAKGRSVDKRADIWAFGVILYETVERPARVPGRGHLGHARRRADARRELVGASGRHAAPPHDAVARLPHARYQATSARHRRRETRHRTAARRISGHGLRSDLCGSRRPRRRSPRARREPCCWRRRSSSSAPPAPSFSWSTFGPGARSASGTMTGPIRLSVSIPSAIHATRAGITKDGRTLIVSGNCSKA